MGYFNQNPLPPKFGKTPLELLSEKTVDPPSLASAWGFQTGMGLLGAGCHLCKNWIYRRPFISGNLLITIFSLEMFNITIDFVSFQVFRCIQSISLLHSLLEISSWSIDETIGLNEMRFCDITLNCIQKTSQLQVMTEYFVVYDILNYQSLIISQSRVLGHNFRHGKCS